MLETLLTKSCRLVENTQIIQVLRNIFSARPMRKEAFQRDQQQQEAELGFQVENFDNTINSRFDLPLQEQRGQADIDNDVI